MAKPKKKRPYIVKDTRPLIEAVNSSKDLDILNENNLTVLNIIKTLQEREDNLNKQLREVKGVLDDYKYLLWLIQKQKCRITGDELPGGMEEYLYSLFNNLEE